MLTGSSSSSKASILTGFEPEVSSVRLLFRFDVERPLLFMYATVNVIRVESSSAVGPSTVAGRNTAYTLYLPARVFGMSNITVGLVDVDIDITSMYESLLTPLTMLAAVTLRIYTDVSVLLYVRPFCCSASTLIGLFHVSLLS